MLNINFKGRLMDMGRDILLKYEIVLWFLDPNPLIPDKILGTTATNNNSNFKLVYSLEEDEELLDNKSKFKVEIRFLDEKIYEITFTSNIEEPTIDSNVIKFVDKLSPVSLKNDYELGKAKTDKKRTF